MIRRLAICSFALGIWSSAAVAQPKVGDSLGLAPAEWGKHTWTLGPPSGNDAAGKVVIHWFCTPKVKACIDDLARIITLRENGGVYVVGYVNGSLRDAKKLDPIRESEGVGRGTVATGSGVRKLFKQLGIAKGPSSFIVDVDGKVKAVTMSADLNELDSRDAVVKQLVEAIKPYTMAAEGPKTGKPGDRLTFKIEIQLASWLGYSKKAPMELAVTAANDIKCDAKTLKGDQLKIDGRKLTAAVNCTAPKGSYQVRGELRFGYEAPNGATGLGAEAATWSFEIKP